MGNNKNCLLDVIKLIDNLQKCSLKEDSLDNSCSRPFLGLGGNLSLFNTRPVTFYHGDNSLVSIDYFVNGTQNTSSVFRIEDVKDNCVTVRLLSTNSDGTYGNTGETALININCICAMQCLSDISLVL